MKNSSTISKKDKLKKDLLKGKRVSGLNAWKDYGLYRLSDAIKKLRDAGMNIITELKSSGGSVYGVYYLSKRRKA